MAGGQHTDDLVALVEAWSLGVWVPDVEHRTGEVHIGDAGFRADHGGDKCHLEDGAGVETREGDFDEQPFFRIGDVFGERQRRGKSRSWEGIER